MILRGTVTAVTGDVATVDTGTDETEATSTLMARNGTGRSPGDVVDVLIDRWRAVIIATAIPDGDPVAVTGGYYDGRRGVVPKDNRSFTETDLAAFTDGDLATYLRVDNINPDYNGLTPKLFYSFSYLDDDGTAVTGPGDVTVTLVCRVGSGSWDILLSIGDYLTGTVVTETVTSEWTTLTATRTLPTSGDSASSGWVRPTDDEDHPDLDIAALTVTFTPA